MTMFYVAPAVPLGHGDTRLTAEGGQVVTRQEQRTGERFRGRYGEDRPEFVLQIERTVIGGDWGANGYTTMAQADLLGDTLSLAPAERSLDLGAGRGWPGLYLAVARGCRRRAQRRPGRRAAPRPRPCRYRT